MVGQSETSKALNESHHSLPQRNPAAVSDIVDNPEKICLLGLSRFSCHGRCKRTSDLNFSRQNTTVNKKKNFIWTFLHFSVKVNAWHSELSTLNFRDSENFSDLWNAIQWFFDLQNPHPDQASIFVSWQWKPQIIWKFYFFRIIEVFRFRKKKKDFRIWNHHWKIYYKNILLEANNLDYYHCFRFS